MNEIHALTLASMQHDMARLDQVASNLANATTPAYQRQVVVARAFTDALAQAEGARPAQVLTDSRPGSLQTTGRPLDIALQGEGYLEVLTQQGPAYTRRGNLAVDARGRLTTSQGHPIMAATGDLQMSGRHPLIDGNGNVSEVLPDGTTARLGRLKVVRFEAGAALARLGDGLHLAPEGQAPAPVPEPEVAIRQGALENANVNTAREMVELMQTMRHFETLHRVVQGYDEMVGGAVRRLTEN